MADIRSSTWSTTANDNNASPPDGWPEGQSPSSVNNCAREMMAAIKRAWNDDHPVNASAGSNSAYTLVTSASSTAYATGDMYAFRANHASVGTSTLNVNGIGARVIKKFGNQDTIADDIKVNQVVQVAYEPSADVWQLLTAADAPNLSNLTDVDLSGGAATGDALVYDGTNWSASGLESQTRSALNASGSAPIYACRAWCNMDASTMTINQSGNIASVARSAGFASGSYTVTFTDAMPDANFVVSVSHNNTFLGGVGFGDYITVDLFSSTGFRLNIRAAATGAPLVDNEPTILTFAVFR